MNNKQNKENKIIINSQVKYYKNAKVRQVGTKCEHKNSLFLHLGNTQNQTNTSTANAAGPAQQQQPQTQQQQQQTGATQNGGQADYSAQWAEYYRSIGKIKEAEAIEAQMKAGKVC